MPGAVKGSITPVVRWVHIFPKVEPSNWIPEPDSAGFYSEILVPAADSVLSDANGFFQAPLDVGSYSLFVREGPLFYSNQGNTITVTPDSVARFRLKITYSAFL